MAGRQRSVGPARNPSSQRGGAAAETASTAAFGRLTCKQQTSTAGPQEGLGQVRQVPFLLVSEPSYHGCNHAERVVALSRAASNRRIDLDRQKRDAIEQQKQQELDAQRAQVTSWQTEVGKEGVMTRSRCLACTVAECHGA